MRMTQLKSHMASRLIQSHIEYQESVLSYVRSLITEKGETTEEVQQIINNALDELEGWYEMRDQFE
jgi:hypothetical protein